MTREPAKPRKREAEAAAEFVIRICQHVPTQWPNICRELRSFESTFEPLLNDKFAAYEFTLAIIAIQMRSLGFLPPEQASRIRLRVLECLITEDTGEYPRQIIELYDAAWDQWASQNEIPFFGIAYVLYDKLGLSSISTSDGNTAKDPIVLSLLVDIMVRLGGTGWWKKYTETNEIVN